MTNLDTDNKSNVVSAINEIAYNSNSALTDEMKAALLVCFQNVAWVNDDGQTYYDALYEALYDTTWMVTNTLRNCITNNQAASVIKGNAYTATLTPNAGYTLTGATVTVTMGGADVTTQVYSSGVISIASVTGNVVITVSASALVVESISAVYTQTETIYAFDSLDTLKDELVVTGTYADSSTAIIPSADYT